MVKCADCRAERIAYTDFYAALGGCWHTLRSGMSGTLLTTGPAFVFVSVNRFFTFLLNVEYVR